jgi:hypothetical protein
MNKPAPRHPGPLPGSTACPDPDPEWTEYVAWLDREAAAGRSPEPDPWVAEDDEPWEPARRGLEPDGADFAGPAPTGPVPAGPVRLFAQDGDADVMAPGPLLAALTELAAGGAGCLSDAEIVGALRATQRQVAREQYKQMLLAAEFGRRRRATFEDALRRGVPAGCAAGGFPGEELAIELAVTRAEAGHLIDDAIDLTARLPCTLAGMASGLIDADRAGWIVLYTRDLSPADAARADEVLAEAAPDLRVDQVARKAAALEMRLNPEGVRLRKEHAKRDGQRVEARREASGNASLSGRELDTADVLAAKSHIDALAVRLRNSGLVDGTLDRLRALVLIDLTQGRDPLDRILPPPAQHTGPSPAPPASHGGPRDRPADVDDGSAGQHDNGPSPARPGVPAPFPALINLLVPAGALLGWSDAPAEAGIWGLLDRDETRTVVTAAAAHPRTRWCVTLTGPDGTALAHGCAPGQHPRLLTDLPDPLQPQPPPQRLTEVIRRLGLTLTPIARDACDHATAEGHYTPSRALRHLVRARTAACDAPGCQAPAVSADLDHTRPWPAGPTDQCNLAPRCRTHHRAKQAPDWTVQQVAPGVTRWTLPSGRTHVTTPTTYDI